MDIKVINNQMERALRDLKRKLIREGLFREISKRRFYAKPSVKAKLKREEAQKRRSRERVKARSRTF
ncbi:MAG: 30S ribosomal protein S21 [SAR324 cluster bacterium]|nr:30S ribosomal protein S21 [SAR324 cluster bacterium]